MFDVDTASIVSLTVWLSVHHRCGSWLAENVEGKSVTGAAPPPPGALIRHRHFAFRRKHAWLIGHLVLMVMVAAMVAAVIAFTPSAKVLEQRPDVLAQFLIVLAVIVHLARLLIQDGCARKLRLAQERYRRDADQLRHAMQNARHQRSFQKLKKNVFRLRSAPCGPEQLIKTALKYLVPNPRDGFAAYLEVQGGRTRLRHSRGLSRQCRQRLCLDRELIERLSEQAVVCLTAGDLHKSTLFDSLPAEEWRKIRKLYLLRLADQAGLVGIILTTTLYQVAESELEQLTFTTNLLPTLTYRFTQLVATENVRLAS